MQPQQPNQLALISSTLAIKELEIAILREQHANLLEDYTLLQNNNTINVWYLLRNDKAKPKNGTE
jgi:hypothetical protein